MSAETQRTVADFVLAGGKLLVAPDFPRTDLNGKPCTLLADALGAPPSFADAVDVQRHPVCLAEGLRVYGLNPQRTRLAVLRHLDCAVLLAVGYGRTSRCRSWRKADGDVF